LATKSRCQRSRVAGTVGWFEHRTVDLAPEDCYLVAQHDDLDGEVFVTAAHEPDQLEDTAERLVEERERHFPIFAGAGTRVKVQVTDRG
jgi:hypothetical protein